MKATPTSRRTGVAGTGGNHHENWEWSSMPVSSLHSRPFEGQPAEEVELPQMRRRLALSALVFRFVLQGLWIDQAAGSTLDAP